MQTNKIEPPTQRRLGKYLLEFQLTSDSLLRTGYLEHDLPLPATLKPRRRRLQLPAYLPFSSVLG